MWCLEYVPGRTISPLFPFAIILTYKDIFFFPQIGYTRLHRACISIDPEAFQLVRLFLLQGDFVEAVDIVRRR